MKASYFSGVSPEGHEQIKQASSSCSPVSEELIFTRDKILAIDPASAEGRYLQDDADALETLDVPDGRGSWYQFQGMRRVRCAAP
jgi:hypothetical protein